MKVKEALGIFGIKISKEKYWCHEKRKMVETDRDVIDSYYGDTLANDRNLLKSNFESEVLYLKHKGMIGLLGFKMRNGQMAFFGFNNPLDWRSINRDNATKQMSKYKTFLEFSNQPQHDIDSGELTLWLSLKTIGGK